MKHPSAHHVRQLLQDGLRLAGTQLGPDPPQHIPHLKLRLPQGADASAIARAVREAMNNTPVDQTRGATSPNQPRNAGSGTSTQTGGENEHG